jgi:hypothetical protein
MLAGVGYAEHDLDLGIEVGGAGSIEVRLGVEGAPVYTRDQCVCWRNQPWTPMSLVDTFI